MTCCVLPSAGNGFSGIVILGSIRMELPDSASVGPMGPLLCQLVSSAKPGAPDLQLELERLYKTVVKHLYKAEDPSHTAMWWMKEVRDLCHEIKDYCDLSVPAEWDFTAFVSRLQVLIQRAISSELTAGSLEQAAATPKDLTVRPPVPAPSIKDLVEQLAFGDETAKQLRAVTLFGLHGALNTRVARTVYDLYGGRFQCRAFIRLSKETDMRSIFSSILSQIKATPDDGFSDVDQLILAVNNHLQDKRYLIIIDDLWTTPEQNLIMGAFPGGYCYSRIITTTQSKDVALSGCDSYLQKIFEMTPLDDDESERNQIPVELNHTYSKLSPELKTCLLYLNMYQSGCTIRKDELVKQWIAEGLIFNKRVDSVGICSFGLQKKNKSEDPIEELVEDHSQEKKLAEDYFDDLVSRALIQPAERNWNGEVMSYSVQHLVLEMIARKCREVDFITRVNYSENTGLPDEARRLSIHFRGEVDAKIPENLVLAKIRSLAFSGFYGCVPSLVECRLLRVLILHIWGDRGDGAFDLSRISQLLLLRYIKVACNITVNLPDRIGQLQLLKTLEVDARVGTVPSDISRLEGLLHLHLPCAHLPDGVSAMKSIRTLGCFDLRRHSDKELKDLLKLESLEDLHLTCSTTSEAKEYDIQRMMDVIWGSILWQNTSLRSVDLVPTDSSDNVDAAFLHIKEDTGASTSGSPQTQSVLERLELSPRICIFSSIPKRLRNLSKLRVLKISVVEISCTDMEVLKAIPQLSALSLYVWTTFGADKADSENQKMNPQRLVIGKEGFPALRYFKFTCPAPCLGFLPQAMTSVRRLKLRFNASSMAKYSLQCAGLENLTGLEQISVKFGNDGGSEFHLRGAQSLLESASAFPKHQVPPIVNMRSVDHIYGAHQAADSISSLPSDSSSNQGEEESWRRTDDVHHAKAMRLLIYIIGHKNYKFIKREKEHMITIIEGNEEDNQGASKEKWILQLQELVYDIEDFIYNLSRLTRISSVTDIVARMNHLKGRINTLRNWQHTAQWSQRGDGTAGIMLPVQTFLLGISNSLGYQTPSCYTYTPEPDLIGINEPKMELMELMSQGDMQLRVISIVGCRGSGKSTLARTVYDDIYSSSTEPRLCIGPPSYNDPQLSIEAPSSGEHQLSTDHPSSGETHLPDKFQCFAWVFASDCSSGGDLLNKIRQQIVPEEASSITHDDYLLRRTLSKQRYILVIDQVERADLWHGIKDAFPKCNNGSRIIVTTSIRSVAAAAANNNSIYTMPSLGDKESESLFCMKYYGRDTKAAPVLADASESILKKCDGLPLSLLSVSRYFREHSRIDRFGRFIGGGAEALGETNSALAHCYSSLPDNGHRECLLSLSIFPQGHRVNRKNLIRRWLAEGLVAGDGLRNGEEVAADRFDELIDRNIIEPVVIGNNSRVKRCRVRGSMLEFIINKAISRNMVTLIRGNEVVPNNQNQYLVRRLSVQDGSTEGGRVATETGLSAVRSLTVFKNVVLDLRSCKLLRILDLEGCKGINDSVLDALCQAMLILKYLSLRRSDVRRIPKRIRRLQYLETMDLRETVVEKLPIEAIMLPCLAHLFGKFDLPGELKDGKKKSKLHKFLSEKSRLQTVSGFVMDKNSGWEAIILEVRSLRKVKIWCKRHPSVWSHDIERLVSALNKRFAGSNALESLSINLDTHASPEFLQSLETPCRLSSMKLSGQIGKLPDFLTSRKTTLWELELCSTGLSSDELSLLQNLRRLRYLKLQEDRWGFGSGEFVIDSDGFESLERLCFQAQTIPKLVIKEGATTKLASLYLICQEYQPSRVEGIQHLQHLSEVVLHDSLEASEVEVWKKKAMEHENRPRVTKQRLATGS